MSATGSLGDGFLRRIACVVLVVSILPAGVGAVKASVPGFSLDDALNGQRAVERVHFNHRIWPKENAQPKPAFEDIVPEDRIRAQVEDARRKESALQAMWSRSITAAELQAELDRMAAGTRDPVVLRELFAALGSDAAAVAEVLVRPVLADRMLRALYASDEKLAEARTGQSFDSWWVAVGPTMSTSPRVERAENLRLPPVKATGCSPDSWRAFFPVVPPDARSWASGVWTGAGRIVWGGTAIGGPKSTGGRYDPATDTWTSISTGANVPAARWRHTAVWTGTEMIVWGGYSDSSGSTLNTGGRYDRPRTGGSDLHGSEHAEPTREIDRRLDRLADDRLGRIEQRRLHEHRGRYDPVADAWTTTATGGSNPSAR